MIVELDAWRKRRVSGKGTRALPTRRQEEERPTRIGFLQVWLQVVSIPSKPSRVPKVCRPNTPSHVRKLRPIDPIAIVVLPQRVRVSNALSNARGEERSNACVRAKSREFHSSCD